MHDKKPHGRGFRAHIAVRQHEFYSLTTILPNCALDSRKRVASTISSNGNVLAICGLNFPALRPSVMNALARESF